MKLTEEQKQEIRQGRQKFVSMAGAYAMGVFNDNFFKQAAMLLAVGVGLDKFQGYAIVLFTIPYIAFASYAGWLADRFSKGHVVMFAKGLEVVAMICGAAGMITGNWYLIMAMVFTMGLQSAIFSPSLNGSIPELYPDWYVTRANSILKVSVTGMILGGVALAGVALDVPGPELFGAPFGRIIVAAAVLLVSVIGFASSFGVPKRAAASPNEGFPWLGPIKTLQDLVLLRRDKLLAKAVTSNVFVWFSGSLLIPLINKMGITQFGLSNTKTSMLTAAELVGIAIGGLLAGQFVHGKRWYKVLPPAAAVLALFAILLALAEFLPHPMIFPVTLVMLGAMGIAGGFFMIPCESFIQTRPEAHCKGSTIAAANCVVFIGMLLSGPIANGLNELLKPSRSFAIFGVFALCFALWLRMSLPRKEQADD